MGVNESTSRRIVGVSLAVYLPLATLGVAWAALGRGVAALSHPEPWLALDPLARHGLSAGLGLGVAIVTVLVSQRWTRTFRWARALHLSFREVLGGLGGGGILLLALASGLGEELFFRVGMQPTLGYVATSLIFGVVHIGPDRRFLPWTLFAVVMGFALGGIYQASGSIVGPILAHVSINAANLGFIVRHDPRGPAPTDAPRIVGRAERR